MGRGQFENNVSIVDKIIIHPPCIFKSYFIGFNLFSLNTGCISVHISCPEVIMRIQTNIAEHTAKNYTEYD